MSSKDFKGWHRRGFLPHLDVPNRCQAITFRLADSVPAKVIEQWKAKLDSLGDQERQSELHKLIARYEDAGHGTCCLRDPENAVIAIDNLKHFDPTRYRLIEWCVMPNHVHVLIHCSDQTPLDQIVRSWKNYTARLINARTGRSGRFWEHDYYDRLIRDEEHLARARHYIRMNPVKAGLCRQPQDWPFSSAARN
jgi:REP element-mobilizing transposase RayT